MSLVNPAGEILTLEQALERNRSLIKTNRSDRRTIKRWYAQGYYMRSDGNWYSMSGDKEYRKYSTAG